MKRLLLLILILNFVITSSLNAQTNSVLLNDGSGTIISQHNSITSAYNAIPATLTQAYIIELTNSYDGSNEVYPIVFLLKAGASAANTITLRPEANVTSVTITSVQTGTSLIRLDDADWIIIDGRPGGVGTSKALTIDNQGTSSSSYGIHLINGASNNHFLFFNIKGFFSASSGGRGIYIGDSPNNTGGNSDNNFEFLTFGEGPRYHLNSSGTVLNKNNNIRVYGCEFKNIKFCGWWQQNGTGKVTIDSCFFYSDILGGGTTGTAVFPIISDFQSDTTIVTRNHIYNIDNSSNATDVIGMCFRSFNIGSVLRVNNNFISLMAPNPSVDELFGIELGTNSMNNPVDAEIYYNTVRIGGTATGGTIGNLNSAAFSIDESNPGSTINVRNNIFVNERTGGNEHHVAIALTESTGNITLDYNTYNDVSPDFAKYLTAYYPTFTAYQTAVSPLETNSNDEPVQFVSATDLHLTGNSIGNPALAGINISSITTDIDNEIRTLPYRGADEASPPGCFDTQLSHSINIFTSPSICLGDSAGMNVVWNPMDTISSIDIQWQFSTNGISFSDITGAVTDTLYVSPLNTTYYRYALTCQSSGSIIYSSSVQIEITPPPTISVINHFNTGMNYTFTAITNQSPTVFNWDFGDGNTQSATNTISHTYASAGTYTVSLTVFNNCGDSASAITNIVITGLYELPEIEVGLFPNPANEFVIIEAKQILKMELYNIAGELIMVENVNKLNEATLKTGSLFPGTYFLKIITAEGVVTRKLEIAR